MDVKKFARRLDGREYGYPMITEQEISIARENGFVIVTGASDDLMEFSGAIYDEGGCFDGGKVYFDKDGVPQDGTERANSISAIWCDDRLVDEDGGKITWTYETDIPHETFMVYEDGESYCRGIIFSIDDVK